MAAVDSLLKFISARNAQALSILSNGVPELRRAGVLEPLSMPPLSAMMVGNFLREVGGEDATEYRAGDGTEYEVTVEGQGDLLRITFATAAQTSPAPAAQATTAVESARSEGQLDRLLATVERLDASDLILSAGVDAWVRVAGAMQVVPNSALSESQILEAFDLEPDAMPADGSMDLAIEREGRYRVNVFRQCNGIAAALRPIRSEPPSLEALHLPPALSELVDYRNGLVLVAGTAGSGKSTTLAALIEHMNVRQARHIITLEDPIEYRYQNKSSLIHQREVGTQVSDFSTGLRAALRESPDVLLVGELRDRETIAAAITAAETGHLVLGTIHASCAMVAIDRIIDIFPAGQQRQIRYQLASILRATLTQHLVASPLPPGRMPAVELMRSTSAVAANIRDDKTYQLQSAIQTGRRSGMITLELSLAGLVKSGRIRRGEAEAVAKDQALLAELLASGA